MIDPLTEQIVSLPEGAKFCPERRSGKKPHVSCLYRWTNTGCKGVVLESLQVGGTRCTSLEAMARFFNRLTAAANCGPAQSYTSEQELEAVEKELKAEGI